MMNMTLLNTLSRTFPANLLLNNIKVGNDLDAISHIGEEDHTGTTEDYQKITDNIWRATQNLYKSAAHPAIFISVRHKGKHILNRAIGHARGELDSDDAVVVKVGSPICLFSGSKAITALLLHKMVELGLVDLDAPIADYIEEFATNGKGHITVDDLLRHKGGVPDIKVKHLEELYDHHAVVKQLCEAKLDPLFKNYQAYHPLSGGYLIEEIINRVTGESIETILDRYFREPMDMTFFNFGLDEVYRPMAPHNAATGMKSILPIKLFIDGALGIDTDDVIEASNSEGFYSNSLPAGNMYASAEECSRFYQMLLDDGQYNGKQILKPETIEKALQGPRCASFDKTMKLPIRFSSGLMRGGAPMNLFGLNSPNSFGHLGYLNNFTWADPDRDLSVAILTTGKQVVGPHLLSLNLLLANINRQFKRQ